MSDHHHKWWMSEYPSVLELVFRCNCGATLTSAETILAALNLKETRIEALEKLTRRECTQGHKVQGDVIVVCGYANCGELLADETETGFGRHAALAKENP